MNSLLPHSRFYFTRIRFEKYHYTDNRCGSQLHFIAYMFKGRAKIVSDEHTICISEGDVFFIPRHLSYQSYWYGEEIDFLSIGFTELEADESIHFELQRVDCDEDIKKRILQIPLTGGTQTCRALGYFYSALADLIPYLKEADSTSKKDLLLKKAQKYIEENTDCSIKDIARYCYISEPYLYAIFKEKSACSPNDYRLKCKCAKGVEALLTSDKTVEEISEQIGFSSAAHFRRALKKYTGLTPRAIRSSLQHPVSP